jgi:hypothetical protein
MKLASKIKYNFTGTVWSHSSPSGWHFVSLPEEMANEIRKNFGWQEEGWGRLKAVAKIGFTEWETAIWFDKKNNTYLLPLKASIRKKEKIQNEHNIEVTISI